MSNPLSAFVRPPARLLSLSPRWSRLLRVIWIVASGLAVLTVLVSTIYAVRATYWIQPTLYQYGLDFEVTTDGKLLVGVPEAAGATAAIPTTAKVVAVNDRPVSTGLQVAELVELIDAAPGREVRLTLAQPNGRSVTVTRSPDAKAPSPAQQRNRDLRFWIRLAAGLLACAVLFACSFLLALRRPEDPVAMLLALAFVGMAATIDPPLQFWMWTDRMVVSDIIASVYFYLLLISLAAFPDGIFVPRALRWLLPLGIPMAILVSLPGLNEDIQGGLGVAVLLAIVAGQVIRFRRQPPGITRQQIKWAGFGFFLGLLLILAAVVVAAVEDPSTVTPLVALSILLLFSLGMAAFPVGLLVALVRFRLWEADTVITRSAAYAVVTLIVGVVWAASSDLVKLVITEVMGRESEAGATTVGAIIAAGVFSPTQSAVLGWTRRKFGGPLDRIEGAAQRLKTWGLSESPEEIALRSLSIIDDAIHPAQAALCLDTSGGRRVLAVRGTENANDRRLTERLDLADEEGSVRQLLLGRRSDGNRYNRQELEAVKQLIPHVADALRVSRSRHSRESVLQQQLEAMAHRLAQLEGSTPKPA